MASILEPKLLTAEEYGELPDDGHLTELVRGRIVEMNRPFTSHGYLMIRVSALLWNFVEQRGLGRVVGGDAGVVTQRDPDSVRGPDVAFYSYERIPRGPRPSGYWPASPELVIDVLTVAVIDPEPKRVHLFSANRESVVLNSSDNLTFPDVLPGFEIAVGQLFD